MRWNGGEAPDQESCAPARRRRSRRWAPVAGALGTALVCSFSIQVGWGSPSAESAGIPADTATSQNVQSDPTTRSADLVTSWTTGFYEANIVGGPSGGDCAPSTPPTAAADPSLDSVFANQQGPGWLGGDSTYSTALPNGEEAFVFSDTLVGTALANGRSSLTGVPHNSEMTGRLPNLGVDLNGTGSSPRTLIPDEDRPSDSWQVASTYVENGSQLVFVNEFASVPGKLFDSYTGRSAIAVMSLASGKPVLSSMTFVPTDPNTQWGSAMTQNGGYDFIYGLSIDTTSHIYYGMKVAHVPVGESLDMGAWTYWNGSGWVAGESSGIEPPGLPLLNGVIPLRGATGYMGVAIVGSAGHTMKVALTFSCSPTGPWSSPQDVYSIPQTTDFPDELAYIATFHPELGGDGLVASYNINSLDGLSALERDDHMYQPHFIEITPGPHHRPSGLGP